MGSFVNVKEIEMEDGDAASEVKAEEVVVAETPEEEEPVEKGFELDDAFKQTLWTNTLYRGLREACRILDSRQALFCILAKSCDHADYVKVVEALCAEHGTHLLHVADGKQLGEWAGLCTYDKEGQAHKVVGASVVVVHQDVAKESDPAVQWLVNYAKSQ